MKLKFAAVGPASVGGGSRASFHCARSTADQVDLGRHLHRRAGEPRPGAVCAGMRVVSRRRTDRRRDGAAARGRRVPRGWDGLTVGDLFERIRISMPQNAPGSLSGQQNADILAFMFQVSKFPTGTDRDAEGSRHPEADQVRGEEAVASSGPPVCVDQGQTRPTPRFRKMERPSKGAPFLWSHHRNPSYCPTIYLAVARRTR